MQGEILEGLVARIVSPESSKHMEEVLKDFPPPPNEGGTQSCSLDIKLNRVAITFVQIIFKCSLFQLLLKSTEHCLISIIFSVYFYFASYVRSY